MVNKNVDPEWSVHEKHWRALGDRVGKLSMDTEDWMNLGWTAQDRRAKMFTRILMKILPTSSVITEHDNQVYTQGVMDAVLLLRAQAVKIATAGPDADVEDGDAEIMALSFELAANTVERLVQNDGRQ